MGIDAVESEFCLYVTYCFLSSEEIKTSGKIFDLVILVCFAVVVVKGIIGGLVDEV